MRSAAGMREYIDGRTERRNGGRTERRNGKAGTGGGLEGSPLVRFDRAGAVDVGRRRPGEHAAGATPPSGGSTPESGGEPEREAAGPKLERAPGSLLPIRGSLT